MGTHQSGTGSLVFGRSSVLPSLQVLMFRGSVCELKWNFQFVDIPHFRVQILFQSGNEHLNSLREERVLRKVKPVKVKHHNLLTSFTLAIFTTITTSGLWNLLTVVLLFVFTCKRVQGWVLKYSIIFSLLNILRLIASISLLILIKSKIGESSISI